MDNVIIIIGNKNIFTCPKLDASWRSEEHWLHSSNKLFLVIPNEYHEQFSKAYCSADNDYIYFYGYNGFAFMHGKLYDCTTSMVYETEKNCLYVVTPKYFQTVISEEFML